MADNVLIATANDVNGAHQKIVNEYLDAAGVPVSVTAATPLPVLASISTAGLATSTGQAAGNSSLSSIDGKTPALGQALITASTPVVLAATQIATLTPPAAITGFATESTAAALNGKIPSGLVVTTGRLQVELPAGGGGLTNTEIRATPLPVSITGGSDATAANQTTEISKLTSIDGKIPALGQALAAASTPIVLTAIQLSSLTPPAAITGFALASNQQTNAITNTEIRATPLPISGAVNTGLAQPLTDTQLRAAALPVTANAGTNLNTSALALEAGNLATIKTNTDKIPALGQALAAASTPIVLTAIQQAALTPPAAITGFNLESTQLLVKAKTDNIPAQGQALAAASLPVVLPAAQITALTPPAQITGFALAANQQTNAITDTQIRATPLAISGTVVVNAGTNLNTSALSLETTQSAISAKLPATLGQKVMSASLAVVLATDQASVPVASTIIDAITTGTITVTDAVVAAPVADGSFRSGASTAGSIVSLIQTGGLTEFSASITNLTSGSLYFEGSLDTTNGTDGNWAAVIVKWAGNQASNLIVASTNGIYRGNLSSIKAVRVRSVGALTGTPAINIRWSQGTGSVHHLSGLQASSNIIGKVGIDQTTPGVTNAVSIPSDADNTATGTLTAAAQTVVLTMGGKSAVGIVITGTWAGTITFEGSVDGTNWNAINAVAASTSTPQSTTIVNGLFRLTPAGLLQVRVIMTAFTSGTATVSMRASAGTGGVFANQVVPVTLISNPAEGVVSIVNSSVTPLIANGIFTGTSEDVTNYSSITVALISNVASATDGLSLQQSPDGTNWDLLDVYTVPAATGKTFAAHISSKFYRLVYTNGATLQGSFRLQTIYHKYQQPAATVRPQDGRSNDNDFGEELSFLMGYNSIANAWNRVGITSGNLGGNETVLDRLKVNASLRMIDTAQTVGSQLVGATGTQALGLNVNLRTSSTLAVTTTAATGVGATLTLPAVAAQFHYITSIKMVLYSTAARTGAATPIVVTTTNAPGALAFTFDTAGAIGTNVIQEAIVSIPLKSSVVNTATTIVAPIVTGGIWRITATYFTGA